MRRLVLAAAIAVAVGVAPHAAAQAGMVIQSSPGMVRAAQTMKMNATITAIEPATREVRLKGQQGNELTVVAGPEVKNFAQMRVGDQVEAEYFEAVSLELKKGGGLPVARVEQGGAGGAPSGMKPTGALERQVTVVADVVEVNPQNQSVMLRGPQHTVELKVNDPAQFKLVAKGDQVQATYTEAVAIAVRPMK